MFKRIICIFLGLLFIFNFGTFDVAEGFSAGSPLITFSGANETVTYFVGDWIVDNFQAYEDKIIDLTGNLTVKDGGLLNIKNVTLRLNVTASNQRYKITIDAGGEFNVMDSDDDPLTLEDGSLITDSILDNDTGVFSENDFRGMITVRGKLNVINSGIEEMGPHYEWNTALVLDNKDAELIMDNSTFINCFDGIDVWSASNILIKNSVFKNIYDTAIYISYIPNTIIFGNTIDNISNYGVQTYNSENLQVSNNVITNTYYGIYIQYGDNNRIENNTIISSYYAIYLYAYRDTFIVKNNFIDIANSRGIYTYRISNSLIENNSINGSQYGIHTRYSDGLTIKYNDITNSTSYGMYMDRDKNQKVHNNMINNSNSYGIYIYGDSRFLYKDILIENNTILNSYYGIYSRYNWGLTIKQNTFKGNNKFTGYAIYLYYSNHNRLEFNDISNYNYGIYTRYGSYDVKDITQVYGGSISETNGYDIYLYDVTYIHLYNVSLDLSDIYIRSSYLNPYIRVFYNIDVFVVDTQGPVGGAKVTVEEKSGAGIEPVVRFTDETGWARSISVLNRTQYYWLTDFFSPYNFSANVSGSVGYADSEYEISAYERFKIVYNIDTFPTPPVDLRIEVNFDDIELHWESYVTDLKGYRVFRNNSIGGWDEVANITSPPPGVKQMWVDNGMAGQLVEFRYKVHHVDNSIQEEQNNDWVLFNDWVITDYRELGNRVVVLNGSLIVEYGGYLNLRNTSVIMNGTDLSPGIKRIEVRDGGKLVIKDFDDNKNTISDNPLVNASEAMGKYEFIVEEGGHLEIYNSRIQNASSEFVGDEINIYINSDNCTIKNTTIISTGYAIYLDEAEHIEIDGNMIYNESKEYRYGMLISESEFVKVANNTIINASWNTIEVSDSNNIEITNNNFEIKNNDMFFFRVGVASYDTDGVSIENNTFTNFSSAISMSFNAYTSIKNNSIYNATNTGIDGWGSTKIVIHQNIIEYNNIFGWGNAISLSDTTILDVMFNTVYGFPETDGTGIFIGSYSKLNLIGNTVTDADYGIYINNWQTHSIEDSMIAWNNIYGLNSNIGTAYYIYDTDDLLFFNNTAYDVNKGFHQLYSEDVLHSGNKVWNATYGFYIQFGSTAAILNSTMIGDVPYTVYLNISSDADLLNPDFNLTKIYISDKTCTLRVHWTISVNIKDHYGIYHPNVFLRVRSVIGTILLEGYTDNYGQVSNIVVQERTQHYNENLSYMPASFEAEYLDHTAYVDVTVDKIMVVDLQLGNTAPNVYNIFLSPILPTTTEDLVLNMGYTFIDNENDIENKSYYKWYRREDKPDAIFELVPSLDNLTSVPSSYTKKGELWYCLVVPSDDLDYGNPGNSQTVRIFNTKPVVNDAKLTPEYPDSLENLKVDYSFFDIDSDSELGTVFLWYAKTDGDFELRETSSVPELDASNTNKGEIWYVAVEPKDGEDSGTALASNNITIGNTYPWVTDIVATPAEPSTSDDLDVSYSFVDIDSDTEGNTTYRWLKDYGLGFLEAGFTTKSVPSKFLTKGEIWMCQVTPFDGELYGATVNSTAIKIDNTAPYIADLQVVPQDPKTVDDLSVTYLFFDRDLDVENATSYEWLKLENDIYIKTGLKIKTLPSIFTEKDETWVCEVTPSDGYSTGKTVRSLPVTIGNSPPVASDLTITPSVPTTTDALKASYDFKDDDNDAESGSIIKWYRNGEHATGLDNELSIDPNETSKEESWYFTVKPGDGKDNGLEYRSDPIEIQNSNPVLSNAKIEPSSPVSNDDLKASYDFSDPDDDTVLSIEIRWYMNGEIQPQYQNKLLIPSNATEKGQSWKFLLSVSDGTGDSKDIESASISIKNTPPEIIEFSPEEAAITITETDNIVFSIDVEDLDGDLLVIQWFEKNKIVGSDFSYVFQTDHTSEGNYTIRVTLQDWGAGSVLVSQEWSITVLNKNRVPELHISEPLNPKPVVKDDKDLRFVVTYNDPDKEDKPEINWYLDGTLVTSDQTTYTYSPSKADIGQHTLHVEVKDTKSEANYNWSVTVKEATNIQEEFMGLNWDQWSIVLETLVIGVTGLVAFGGFLRFRRRKGALQHYMKEIESIMRDWKEAPDEAESRLVALFETIEMDFGSGKIEDFHYFLLDRQIKENLREIRQTKIKHGFKTLPENLKRKMNTMLEDGRITDKEYKSFVSTISTSKDISDTDKSELRKLMRGWKDVDASEGKKKVVIKPVSVMTLKKKPKIESSHLDWQELSEDKAENKDQDMDDSKVDDGLDDDWDIPGSEMEEDDDIDGSDDIFEDEEGV